MAKVKMSRVQGLIDASSSPNTGDVATWNDELKTFEPAAPGGGSMVPHDIQGAFHTSSGLTVGHVLRASAPTAFAFAAIQDGDLPASIARDSEVSGAISAHEAAGDPHPAYTTAGEAVAIASAAVATHEGAADPHATYQKESEKAQANGYASLGADGKVPAAQLPASGGSDPWTRVILGGDFSTSGTANAAVTGMNFTPTASKRYLVEVYLLCRTALATVGPRPGFSWPTGLSDGGAWMQVPTSATAYALRAWGPLNTQNAASTGVPDTTTSHLAIGGAYFITGATPSGTFGVTLASETAGTNVTIRAGSFLMWREIA